MSKAPSMPMYWDAYLADTTHLTTEEHGAYLLLIAAMWRRNGSVPDDDWDNARILGLSAAKWRKVKARFVGTISGFRVADGVITQEKLQKTWENTQEKINKNRKNGAKGGRSNSTKNNDLDKANGFVSVNPNESIPEPEPEPDIKEVTKVTSRRNDSPLEGFDDFWSLWPSKKNKDAARKAWKKLSVDHKRCAYRAIQRGWFDRWQSSQPDANPIHASSFLNGKRWEDDQSELSLRTINGGHYGKSSDNTHRVQRIITAAAEGTSGKDWG